MRFSSAEKWTSVSPWAQAGGFRGVVRTIVAREGPRGFYKGLLPGLIKSAPASAGPHGYYAAFQGTSKWRSTVRKSATLSK